MNAIPDNRLATKRDSGRRIPLVSSEYLLPFILITSLFFMWGFSRATLDVLNKHFQESMQMTIARSTLIQAVTYLGYFLMALPAGILITRFGYRRGVVTGLLLFGIGSLCFIPGASYQSFEIFLTALFVIGCGLAILETAANPYASGLGAPETAASRLNLAQSFNGLGCILAPVAVGGFLFSETDNSVAVPYTLMGVFVLLAAAVFCRVRLPELGHEGGEAGDAPEPGVKESIKWLWSRKMFRLGILALFCYEIAEISINSLFINYATADGWLDKSEATVLLSFGALGLFMLARVAGSWIMSRVAASKVLLVCAVMTVAGAISVTLDIGVLSRCGVFVCYAFEAIMFPTIFAMTISRSGHCSKMASAFMMMTPIGGAVGTSLMGYIADMTSMSTAFIVPAAGYAFVLLYAAYTCRHKDLKTPSHKIGM